MLTPQNTDINEFLYPKKEKTNIISKELWKNIQTETQKNLDQFYYDYNVFNHTIKKYNDSIKYMIKEYNLNLIEQDLNYQTNITDNMNNSPSLNIGNQLSMVVFHLDMLLKKILKRNSQAPPA